MTGGEVFAMKMALLTRQRLANRLSAVTFEEEETQHDWRLIAKYHTRFVVVFSVDKPDGNGGYIANLDSVVDILTGARHVES